MHQQVIFKSLGSAKCLAYLFRRNFHHNRQKLRQLPTNNFRSEASDQIGVIISNHSKQFSTSPKHPDWLSAEKILEIKTRGGTLIVRTNVSDSNKVTGKVVIEKESKNVDAKNVNSPAADEVKKQLTAKELLSEKNKEMAKKTNSC
jgi:carbamoylphosphate synthase small subunit